MARFGEVESVGVVMREMERTPPRNNAVFPPLLGTGRRCKTSKPPRFTKIGQEPNGIKLGKAHEQFHGVWRVILHVSPVCMGIKTPIVQEVIPWSRVSPPSFNA